MLAKKLRINKTHDNFTSKLNIVLIDKNEMLLSLLDHELSKKEKFSVTHTTNGIEFLNRDNVSVDVIVMDMILEGINGIELLKKIRNDQRFDGAKIIVLSEKMNASDIEQLKSLRIEDVIQKPANIGEVLHIVEEVTES